MLIYKIVNKINGHFYIGMTAGPIDKRWAGHLGCVQNGKTAIYKAMRKYGAENFECLVVEQCNNQAHMEEREDYYLQTLKPHYNLRLKGGTGGDTSYTPNHLNARHLMKKSKNTVWYNNGIEQCRCIPGSQPDGYVKGRLFKKQVHPRKITNTFEWTCMVCGDTKTLPAVAVNKNKKYCNTKCNGVATTRLRLKNKIRDE